MSGPSFHAAQIGMAHGAGGEATRQLIDGLIRPIFANPILDPLGDAAVLEVPPGRLAITADSFVVKPLRFPGGSIGELAVNGTINDLAVSGARPLALTATLVLEAGLPTTILRQELEAMASAARAVGVPIVAGDTKVVEHGKADGMYISTTGLGVVDARAELGSSRVKPGDQVLLSGPIGAHGITILTARAELDLEADVESDTRSLWRLVEGLFTAVGSGIHWMRDVTRGGVATVLNELARDAGVGIVLSEEAIPVEPVVRGACELLGLDPLQVANEGQFIAVVAADEFESALTALQSIAGGEQACLLGRVVAAPPVGVVARSSFGGTRVVDMLIGDPLPRIC